MWDENPFSTRLWSAGPGGGGQQRRTIVSAKAFGTTLANGLMAGFNP
jgi:hypothetical protein